MDSRGITVAGVWLFAIVWLVGSFVVGADLLFALIVFFIAIGVSVGVSMSQKGDGTGPKPPT
ncbi:MAG: hypothetical protein KGI26_00980 [Thaumarchaeota archaeon]|nr:hypothetical protein [Nitrososphaerota archaeon]